MPVDWRDDQLIAERNAAQAAEKLWRRKFTDAAQERDTARQDLAAAMQTIADLSQTLSSLEFRYRMLEVTADGLVHAP